jgi:integrase
MPLTDVQIRQAKPQEKFFDLRDGGGLYLRVMPSGGKLWRIDYRFQSKRQTLSPGTYPSFSLAQARTARAEAKALVARGVNPSEQKKADKQAALRSQQVTFAAVASEWLDIKAQEWASATHTKVRGQVTRHLLPRLGSRPIVQIAVPEIIAVLNDLKQRGTLETLHRCLEHINNVFRFAVQTHRAERNIADDLKGAFPAVQITNHAAIVAPAKIGPLLNAIDGYEGHPLTTLALKLLPLVFVRPGELRSAKWAHVDWNAARWEIPAEETKMKKQAHIVPLSTQAIQVLRQTHSVSGGGTYLFPSMRSTDRPMSDNTLNAALRRLGFDKETMTSHGFRAMARTVLDEVLEFSVPLIEHQLAHAVKDANGTAYNRTKHLDQRKVMMQAWADYLDWLRTSSGTRRPSEGVVLEVVGKPASQDEVREIFNAQ